MRLIELLLGKTRLRDSEAIQRKLITREAAIGGQLFGPLAPDARRDFFALDERTWVWHEGWRDLSGRQHLITTRYEINGGRIIKIQDGQPHQLVSLAEARNLITAIRAYYVRVRADVYGQKV